ncbi:MAG: large subunit ribosomal protein [Myxococcales bacterium]|jgi:large subunit ribosomal protein L17|nr:large subunit ribosomal protein [Myxococcales bacterium]
MRHRKAGVHLSRTSAHRKALFSNLIAALLTNERIRTTDAKAKETRRLAERTITWARRVGDVLTKKVDRRSTEESARVVHAVRMARRVVRDRGAVLKLFDEIAPRFAGRRGGYTRIVKLGQRPGDAAPMSLLELLPDENAPAPVESTDKGEKAGKGGKGKTAPEGEGARGGAGKAAAAKKKGAAKAEGGEAAEAPKKAAKKPAKAAKKDE